ncbi:polysaccharide deacetylase family sporulation protein PdaB [Aneurinibacillus soli]|uniref:Peptidoglycan-N-acetylmuramic acid deacetylase PdaA n=1 Tax=Aneurinibacillus soli TaxID=1500254 RepID=A0A0U5AYP2_9BACL|nr:polysaccharide deacetylase family sporulation protein PdaB [Aneurinibacillus soli]PYE57548.1 polysaccharide deacetylase family sporulation protein PdaB [Aneurinibacillus soli]BAU26063.1 Peptidoglycan-N-acetylmuramic acid deacetylase PdaA precursor [Aneurinibacillus soli]
MFWIVNARRIKQYLIIFTAALFALGIAWAERENITVLASGGKSGPNAVYKVDTKEKKLALTFDISWGEERTGPILDILEKKGVKKATFFLSSPWSQSHPDVVKRIKDMGYEIGSHGHKHVNYSSLSDEEIQAQIGKAHGILKDLTGTAPNLIRTPNGDFDKRVLRIANNMGYTVIQWDTDSRDWMNPGTEQIVTNVIKKAHPGDIILMHASDTCKQTHLALPTVIDKLRSEGYEFLSVSELLAGTKVQTKEVQ